MPQGKLPTRLRWPSIAIAALMTVASGCERDDAVAEIDASLIVENVTILDAVDGVRGPLDVVVANDRIVALEPAGAVRYPADVARVDGSDRYLLPGLWDMHVHLTFEPDFGEAMLALFLANGITSVRDTGGALDAVLASRARARALGALAPNVYVAGPLLDGLPVVYDGSAPGYPAIGTAVPDADVARASVRELAAAGVDLIKAYEMLSPEAFSAVIDEATKLGLPVSGHVPLSVAAADALASGLDAVEHLRNIELGCAGNADELLTTRRSLLQNPDELPGRSLRQAIHSAQRAGAVADYDRETCLRLIEMIVANNVAQLPTFALVNSVYAGLHSDPEWQATFDDLPQDMRSQWLESAAQFSEMFGPSSDMQVTGQRYLEWIAMTIADIHASGGTILAGTDTPIFFMTPGASLHKELEVLVAAGLPPIDAIGAATSNAAAWFGREQTEGRVCVGCSADLLLLDANPLDDIRNTRRIHAVVRDGTLHERSALAALKASAAAAR